MDPCCGPGFHQANSQRWDTQEGAPYEGPQGEHAVSQGNHNGVIQPIASTQVQKAPAAVIASTWKPVLRARAQQQDGNPDVTPVNMPPQHPVPVTSMHVSGGPPTIVPSFSVNEPARLAPIASAAHHDRVSRKAQPRPNRHPVPGVPGVPREFEKQSFPSYVIEPPDLLLINALGTADVLAKDPIQGQYLVRPDGTVGLGTYGEVYVSGLTIEQARQAIADQIARRVKDFSIRSLQVDVLAYNSKVFYIITDGGGYGEQVVRVPITGNETVLDALSQIGGLPSVASKKHIWIARATPHDSTHPKILPVDWKAITQYGSAHTNYQIFPGDRLYVRADPWIRIDSGLQKRLSPIERLLGTTLLGSTVVNSIRSGGRAFTGGF